MPRKKSEPIVCEVCGAIKSSRWPRCRRYFVSSSEKSFRSSVICTVCGKEVERRGSKQKYCETCVPDTHAGERFRRFGISEPERQARLSDNGGQCEICGKPGFYLDHDHATGEMRGFLCNPCNLMLGKYENEEWRASVERYLFKYRRLKAVNS